MNIFVRAETERLTFIRSNQIKPCCEQCIHLQDAINADGKAQNIGRMTILPATCHDICTSLWYTSFVYHVHVQYTVDRNSTRIISWPITYWSPRHTARMLKRKLKSLIRWDTLLDVFSGWQKKRITTCTYSHLYELLIMYCAANNVCICLAFYEITASTRELFSSNPNITVRWCWVEVVPWALANSKRK